LLTSAVVVVRLLGEDGVVKPMLATAAQPPGRLPQGPGWSFEVKWDGVRVLAASGDGAWRLASRTERDVTLTYPELAESASSDLPSRQALLDGEVVAFAEGSPSFEALAGRMNVRDAREARRLAVRTPVSFFVFDVLELDGADLTRRPLSERRKALESLALPDRMPLSPVYPDGDDLWQVTRGSGLEGVVAKRLASAYLPGTRSRDWIKARHQLSRVAFVGGWRVETNGSGRLGGLLLGALDDAGRLRYLGRAGSGLTGTMANELTRRLAAVATESNPFDDPVPRADALGTHWVTPSVLVEVTYLERSTVGRMRHPVLRGPRDDAEPDAWEAP
jgi:bifunctional non-homologous end joining protein LigD